MQDAFKSFTEGVKETFESTMEKKPQEVVKTVETLLAAQEKNEVEEGVRAHLRGFSRTIPSFIMAYGDGKLTLENFDDYTEDDVFLEVTGITEDDFQIGRAHV